MRDSCVIRRITSTSGDDFSGVSTPTYLNPDPYSGKCRVQQRTVTDTRYDVGEDSVQLQSMELHLPMSATGLQVNDQVTITSSAQDPDLVGRVFLVRDLFHKTDATARRVGVTERTS